MTEADVYAKQLRSARARLSPGAEQKLFAEASRRLAGRRARAAQAGARNWGIMPRVETATARWRASSPAWVFRPSLAAFALLALALFTGWWISREGQRWGPGISPSMTAAAADAASEFPKYNDGPYRYDQARLAEEQAYEREVEDAHQNFNGGA